MPSKPDETVEAPLLEKRRFEPWRKVLDGKPPRADWFVGGKLDVSFNCVDRHLAGPRRNKAAIVREGEPGDTGTLTYRDSSQGTAGAPPSISSGAAKTLQAWKEFGGPSRSGTPGVRAGRDDPADDEPDRRCHGQGSDSESSSEGGLLRRMEAPS